MKKVFVFILFITLLSCNRNNEFSFEHYDREENATVFKEQDTVQAAICLVGMYETLERVNERFAANNNASEAWDNENYTKAREEERMKEVFNRNLKTFEDFYKIDWLDYISKPHVISYWKKHKLK